MSPTVVLVAVIGCLYAAGVFLLLERSLTRVLLGILLLGNATNLLLLAAGGRAGGPPILGTGPTERMSDPLAQAMILTAIVITFGMAAFLLAMIYRNWQVGHREDVVDDAEDRRVGSRTAEDSEDVLLPTDLSSADEYPAETSSAAGSNRPRADAGQPDGVPAATVDSRDGSP
jgi:multicomponent Na+:H+ antiporter subunit C